MSSLNLEVTFDPSVDSAPTQFKSVVSGAAKYFSDLITNTQTVKIYVSYGSVAGNALAPGALGESQYDLYAFNSYLELKASLFTHIFSTADQTAYNSLPSVDPISVGADHTYVIPTALAKLLTPAQNPQEQYDGFCGFSSAADQFDYDNSDGVSSGQFDFLDVVRHEFSEVLGRAIFDGITIIDGNGVRTNPLYSIYDLYHFSAANQRLFVGTNPGYFSIDNGVTSLNAFNSQPGGDFGDWDSSVVGPDAADAFSNPGVINPFSNHDITAMDIFGWTIDPAFYNSSASYFQNSTGLAIPTSSTFSSNPSSSSPGPSIGGISLYSTTGKIILAAIILGGIAIILAILYCCIWKSPKKTRGYSEVRV